MSKCFNHPDRETSLVCMKHNVYMCAECRRCRDPKVYCKFRTSCPIWFMSKHQGDWDSEDGGAAGEEKTAAASGLTGGG